MGSLLHKIRRYIITVRVEVHPTHPEAPAYMEVIPVWFNKERESRGQFLLLKNGRVDISDVFSRQPRIDHYICHYPEDWFEQIAAYDDRVAEARGHRFV